MKEEGKEKLREERGMSYRRLRERSKDKAKRTERIRHRGVKREEENDARGEKDEVYTRQRQ